MADAATNPLPMTTSRLAMTAAERSHGRYMRAPDGHEGGEAAPVAEPVADAPAATLDDSTILGGDAKSEGGDPSTAASGDDAPKPDDAKPDDAPQGAPEKYELALPEGVTLDETAWATAEPVIRELNLTNEQASKLAAIYPGLAQAQQEAATNAVVNEVIAQRAAWAKETQADPTYGGTNFEASKVNAARFIDSYGGANLRKVMDETGLGNHPALFAAFAKAGAELAEDNPPRGGAVEGKPKTIGEVFFPASA